MVCFEDLGKYVAFLEFWIKNSRRKSALSHYRAYLLCLFTGLRFHEAATLTWDCVNLQSGVVTITAEHSKTKRPHMVYLTPHTKELLLEARMRSPVVSPMVFPPVGGGKSPHIVLQSHLSREIESTILGYPFSTHAHRRTFCCYAQVGVGISFPVVQKMLNHSARGQSVNERSYFMLQRFKPGALRDEFEAVSNGLVELRNEWLAEHQSELCLPGQAEVVKLANWERERVELLPMAVGSM
ncbi:Tyrosine-type recombinase/integrase [Sulfidibacter corallicola]